MKLKHIFLGIITAAIVVWGCDKITNPILQKQATSSNPSSPPDFTNSSTSYTLYKVLLEDCTAHKCPNCPAASDIGEALLTTNLGPHIVLLEDNMGPGLLSNTTPVGGYPAKAFSKYYVCEADSAWNVLFGITAIGLPQGMINRIGYPGNIAYQASNWQTTVQAQVSANPTPSVTINIHDSCWSSLRFLGAEFQVHFNQTLPGTYLLVTGIVEDSIIDWQLDNRTVYGADSNYNHHFVLRGTFDLTGTGLAIPSSKTNADSTWTSYQSYDFNKGEYEKAASWNMAHCYIVAFVYNSPNNTTPYQVVQAEMIKME